MKKLFTLCALTISFNMNSQTGNTSTGTGSLGSLTSGGDYNVANGLESLPANTTGDRNAAYGAYSMYTNVSRSCSCKGCFLFACCGKMLSASTSFG